ncbi:ATP-binding protein [Streptomyces zingiberis]|uniref:ATP-binding protein n=1 Tax=Streptomyces zingiberis TaxID=2053010 RepID=A0ABX1BN59_9ACTN|nr:ATP-binding protein [Streptomyces zingiberis]NJP99173.1 ATP-binding protein [Streptomyces zingiberis]
MSIWWSLHLRREAASVPLARRMLLGALESAGADPDAGYELSLALTEACANAVEHGGAGAEGRRGGRYSVTAYLETPGASGSGRPEVLADRGSRGVPAGGTCRIEVADSGPGFPAARAVPVRATGRRDARAAPVRPGPPPDAWEAEHGRGLLLIEALADHVHIRNRPGRGAVVSFSKRLRGRDGALLAGGPVAGPALSS